MVIILNRTFTVLCHLKFPVILIFPADHFTDVDTEKFCFWALGLHHTPCCVAPVLQEPGKVIGTRGKTKIEIQGQRLCCGVATSCNASNPQDWPVHVPVASLFF